MVKWFVGVCVVAASLGACSDDGDGVGGASAWKPEAGIELIDPIQVSSEGGRLRVTLDAAEATMKVSGADLKGHPFKAEGHDAELIGPTLRVKPGETIEVTLRNNLTKDLNIHYHGLHVSPLGHSDNVFRVIKPLKPGDEPAISIVEIPADHPVGTYWYHVHFHGESTQQVMGGLSGLIILEGLENRLPPDLRGIRQRQLAIREVQPAANGTELETGFEEIFATAAGTKRVVNGLWQPTMSINDEESQLWRLANVGVNTMMSNVRLVDTKTDAEQPFFIIAEDGNPLFGGRIWSDSRIDLPPGKRFDLLVQGRSPGTYELRADVPGPNSTVIHDLLATVTVKASNRADAPDLQAPNVAVATVDDGIRDDLSRLTDVVKRQPPFVFRFNDDAHKCPSGKPSCAMINDKEFKPDYLDVSVRMGTVEEWTLVNESTAPHPFHIHVNEFQVISVNGEARPATGMQDVVTIPAVTPAVPAKDGQPAVPAKPGVVVIRHDFRDFAGWFVFHCHILKHEDEGMMMTIQVLRPGETPSPPPVMEMSSPH